VVEYHIAAYDLVYKLFVVGRVTCRYYILLFFCVILSKSFSFGSVLSSTYTSQSVLAAFFISFSLKILCYFAKKEISKSYSGRWHVLNC